MTLQDEAAVDAAVNAANNVDADGYAVFVPASTDSDDAPYGRKADGTPKRKPGPSKGTRVGAAIPRPTRTGGPRPASSRAKPKTGTDYRQGILGILQIPAFALGAAGQFNEALALDGAALSMHAPAIAEALNELANDNPTVAAALDQILSAGPYGALIGVCLPLAFQLAANHKKIPDTLARSTGAVPADEFREMLMAQRAAA